MTRKRLRESRPAEDEAGYYRSVYPQGYRHDVWPDHIERVAASAEFISRYLSVIKTAADLSCGDGAILRRLSGLDEVFLGDLNGVGGVSALPEGWDDVSVSILPQGLLPGTLTHLPQQVDLFVLSETLEHMDDPDDLLRRLSLYARYLFLSTPINEIESSGNLEHYWSWSHADVHEMLQAAGWDPIELKILVPRSTLTLEHAYHYQLWMAVAR